MQNMIRSPYSRFDTQKKKKKKKEKEKKRDGEEPGNPAKKGKGKWELSFVFLSREKACGNPKKNGYGYGAQGLESYKLWGRKHGGKRKRIREGCHEVNSGYLTESPTIFFPIESIDIIACVKSEFGINKTETASILHGAKKKR